MSDQYSSILSPDKENKTIKFALKLIDAASEDLSGLKTKELGLSLVLFGLAEVQALRISRLSSLVYLLENELLKPENIEDLEPRKLVELYRMSAEALRNAHDYVRSTVSSVKWEQFEAQLLTLANEESGESKIDDSKASEIARKLLEEFTARNLLSNPTDVKQSSEQSEE